MGNHGNLLRIIPIRLRFLIGYRTRRSDWLVYLIMPVAVCISLLLISDLNSHSLETAQSFGAGCGELSVLPVSRRAAGS
jgi:hypothetical protein